MNIGAVVAYYREQKRWSLRELSARAAGLSIGYLSDIEHERTVPSIDSVEKLAAAFEMSVPVFLGGADLDLTAEEHAILQAYRAGDLQTMLRLALERVQS